MTDYSEFENSASPFFRFISDNEKVDGNQLLLKYHNKELPFPLDFAITQIICRRKTLSKLSYFLNFQQFLFPDSISSEQASDERVAEYHAALAGSGKIVVDMTAGLGIDALSIAMRGNEVTACDIDANKSEALRHNAEILNTSNITAINIDSIEFLTSLDSKVDIIFIDPARRDANNRRMYSFADCTPDVIKLMPLMLEKADRIFIKSSPLLDISQIIQEIPETTYIHIVCVKSECKEVLVEIVKGISFQGIRIIDLDDSGIISDILFEKEELAVTDTSIASSDDLKIGSFLYEPNAGLMKLRSAGALCSRFAGIKHVAPNTSLFISEKFYPDFPGRVLHIEEFPDKTALKKLKNQRYCVSARNYPIEAENLRKKLRVKEGIDKFIYAFRATAANTNVICIASKLKKTERIF